jgi:16S rRNA (cytidine1402-2'-O)-methyltransferase
MTKKSSLSPFSRHGILYIVATPIGNLEDITFRAVRILKDVQLIAAEDTRRTGILLRTYGIQTPVTSLYDQNERRKSSFLIAKLNEGEDVAYVSDAGTPGISDPGYVLIRRAIESGIRVVPVPGVSAVITALSVSGLPMDAFAFHAFPPSRSGQRRAFLESLKDERKTMVFYESPKRLISTLKDMKMSFGDRDAVILREMTKVYEEAIRGTLSNIIDDLDGKDVRGEITLIVAGRSEMPEERSDDEIRERIEKLLENTGLSRRDIVNKLTEDMGVSKARVYRLVNLLFP